jgi:hypothetical protein
VHAQGAIEWPLTWVDRARRDYNARFTFSAGELVAAVGARVLDPTSAELVDEHLDGATRAGAAVVAFLRDASPFLVATQSPVWLSLDDLFDLSSWAAAALDASSGFSPVVAHAVAHSAEAGAVAWTYEGLSCAALALGGPALRRLVARLEAEGAPLVLATKLPVLDRVRDRAAALPG